MKKGFTLIELLAVVIVLSLIMVIAVPYVMKTLNDSKKKTFETTPNTAQNHAMTNTAMPWATLTSCKVISAHGVEVPAIRIGIAEWSASLALRFVSPIGKP